MKILITSDLYTTDTNGVVTSLKNLYSELKKRGHDVRILTFSDKHESHRDGDIYFIRSAPMGVIYPDVRVPTSYRHKLITELIEWRPDVIHSQCEFFSYRFAKRISRKTGAPIIHTYHTLYEQYATYVVPSKRLGRFIVKHGMRMILRSSKVIIAPTKKVEAALRSYGIKNKIAVIPSGIDLSRHKDRLTAEERTKKRAVLGISEDDTVLINLGRLGHEKKLDDVIRYFADARKKHPKIKLLIVGGGPAKDDLEALSKKLGLMGCVIFTGMVEPGEVSKFYQLGDIFVSASTSETQGLTYVEASANSLPLLCRRDLCLDGIFKYGENGLDFETEEGFHIALDAILADPNFLIRAGERSLQLSELFSKEHFGDSVESLYFDIIGVTADAKEPAVK